MNKKIIDVLLCAAMLTCSAAGCKADNNSGVDPAVEQSHSIEYKAIEPPEEGWTIESLVNTMTFFGKEISYPMTLEQFGDDFSINTSDPLLKNDKIGVELYYKNEFVCIITYTGLSSVDDIKEDTPIRLISVSPNEKFGNYFEINSVTFGTEWNEVTKCLGSPTDGADKESDPNSSWEYHLNSDGDHYLYIGISNDKVSSFLLGEF